MASSSITPLLFRILLICIVIDIVTRYYEKPPIKPPSKKDKSQNKEDKYENPLKDVEIDTSLDEDDDDSFVDTKKKKPKKKLQNETEEENENEKEKEKEKEPKKEKKSKKSKKSKSQDDEDDQPEESRDFLTIMYDKKSFQKYYDKLKLQILGNFTHIDIEEKEYPLSPNKQFFSKFTFFTQMGISIFIFSGQKLKDKLTMIPPFVFDTVEKNKWFVMIGNFFFHQWLNRYLSTTGAFEVYYKDRLIFSKLATNRLPSEADIHKQLRKYVKNKKNKKSRKNDDDDDDDEDL